MFIIAALLLFFTKHKEKSLEIKSMFQQKYWTMNLFSSNVIIVKK
jgi:hypothetical protein